MSHDISPPDYTDLSGLTPLAEALSFAPSGEDKDQPLLISVSPDFSNGPVNRPPEKGFPFGGLLAALAVQAAKQRFEIKAPLRTLNVQFLSAAKYGETIGFKPQILRAGRSVTFGTVQASQGDRFVLNASGTWGSDVEWPDPQSDLVLPPPPLDAMKPGPGLEGPSAPRFTRYVDYRFETGPNILGGNIGKAKVERLWMRTADGAPLDELRLCFLLDALYPPAMTLSRDYLTMTSVDLRYDILREITPDLAPEGWIFVEYHILEHDFGWSIDDATAWAPDGRPIALSRQRRKVI